MGERFPIVVSVTFCISASSLQNIMSNCAINLLQWRNGGHNDQDLDDDNDKDVYYDDVKEDSVGWGGWGWGGGRSGDVNDGDADADTDDNDEEKMLIKEHH